MSAALGIEVALATPEAKFTTACFLAGYSLRLDMVSQLLAVACLGARTCHF